MSPCCMTQQRPLALCSCRGLQCLRCSQYRLISDRTSSIHVQVDLSFFSNSTFGQYVRHMLLKGTLQDHTVLQKRLRIVLEDVTFADAYNKSGQQHAPLNPTRLAMFPVL